MNKRIRFLLVGPGKVGVSLGAAWVRAGHRCVGVAGGGARNLARARKLLRVTPSRRRSTAGIPCFDLLVLAVPDRMVSAVACAWAERVPWKGRIALHTSGALGSSVLEPLRQAGARVGSLHPLLSFSRREIAPDVFQGVYFGLQGDPEAVRIARRMSRDIGGLPVPVREEGKALYHLGACLASGYLLGLIDAVATRIAGNAAPPAPFREALLVLAQSTLRNARRDGLEASLTGPILRGDLISVEAHLRTMRPLPPEWKALCRTLARHTLHLARHTGRISPRDAARFRRIL